MSVYDFTEELRASKKELIKSIEEVKKDNSLIIKNANEIRSILHCITALDIYELKKPASKAYYDLVLLADVDLSECPSVETYCSILSTLIEQIDVAIIKEERVGVIAEKLSQVHVSLPNEETDPELERKIRDNAGAIARIIS